MKNNKKLIYNVFVENINEQRIEPYNIFDHSGFYEDLLKIKKDFKKAYKKFYSENDKSNSFSEFMKWSESYKNNEFTDSVIKVLHYYFWSKSEWEVVITSWPPFITKTEFEKLKNEDTSTHYRYTIDPEVADKVDVFAQVMVNKDLFIDYLWANMDSIR